MVNSFFSAKLIDYNTIRIAIFSALEKDANDDFHLYVDGGEEPLTLKISKQTFLNGIVIYECRTQQKIELGHEYIIECRNFGMTPLNVNGATDFENFDVDYSYSGNDLGVTYTKEKTTFKIWAPLASKVSLFLKRSKREKFISYKMLRDNSGVFEITLPGDYDGYLYRYRVTNSGLSFLVTDPYAKGSTANGLDSAVINPEKINVNMNDDCLPKNIGVLQSFIYEFHVRDFTIDSHTNIKNKGKYLGVAEEGRTTEGGNPAGLDYLKYLGITHAQVLPIYDYKTVDETNPFYSYNWGYDPQQYFVPEGSYSTNPDDPYSRIIELKTMISNLHKAGIRVNMDVVFNHVYRYESSVLEKIVPNYYFRKNKNGTLCNGSGCGNDLATERKMVRKLITDCLTYWCKEYSIDGFRFDLMGLIDIDTLKYAEALLKNIKKDIMLYGEGWDMATNLPSSNKATIYNSNKLPNYGYFNDSFREIVRGNNDLKFGSRGYALGNPDNLEGMKYAFLSSSVNYCFDARFISPAQSLNYVECHDNCTIYDKIYSIYKEEFKSLQTIKLMNYLVTFSFGIPFFHAGQEIGLSKFNEDNTYNKGDKYNKFDYAMLDKRFDYAHYLKSLIACRKEMQDVYPTFNTPELIGSHNEFINLENGALAIRIFNDENEYMYFINPTDSKITYSFDDYYLVLVANAGHLKNSNLYVRNAEIFPHTGYLMVKKLCSNI